MVGVTRASCGKPSGFPDGCGGQGMRGRWHDKPDIDFERWLCVEVLVVSQVLRCGRLKAVIPGRAVTMLAAVSPVDGCEILRSVFGDRLVCSQGVDEHAGARFLSLSITLTRDGTKNSDRTVDSSSPPMTTTAMESPPSPTHRAIGNKVPAALMKLPCASSPSA